MQYTFALALYLISSALAAPISKLDQEKLLYVIESSGILSQSQTAKRVFLGYENKFPKPIKGLTNIAYQKYVANFIKENISKEQLDAVYQLFQDAFLLKTAHNFLSDFIQNNTYKEYILNKGQTANKERLDTVIAINEIFLWSPDLDYGKKTLNRLIIAMKQVAGGALAGTKIFEQKIDDIYIKTYGDPFDQVRRTTVQALYYKTLPLKYSELKEFLRVYKDNQHLKDYYLLNLRGQKTFFDKLYQANTQ